MTAKSRKRVSLDDIAAQTGFSLPTVSKVLNDREGVAQSTRVKVKRALTRAGYVRRIDTQAAKRNTLEVVFQTFDNVWSLEVLTGVLEYAREHNLVVTVSESSDRQHPDSEWLRTLEMRRPVGVIFMFSNLTEQERETMCQLRIPYVIFDPLGSPVTSELTVLADNWTGGVLATRHLLSLGHVRIGTITGSMDMMCSQARLDGYRAALNGHKIVPDPSWIAHGDFSTFSGYTQGIKMLRQKNRPTAIFAQNDLMAMGVYEAARQLHLRIPEDLSVVGFDDVPTSAFLGPSLTTVHQPLRDMAGKAAEMVCNTAKGKQTTRRVILPTSLVIRNSTRKLSTPQE
jgi:LacI family transcriptional regulator